MKTVFPFAAGLLLTVAAAGAFGQAAKSAAPPAADASARVATVNGVPIPKARVDAIVKAQSARGVPDSPGLRDEIKEFLIARELVAQEATRKGLARNADVAAQLDLARQEVLWAAYINDFVSSSPVSDAALRAEYDRMKAQRGDKEYRARHILVEQEDQAKQVIADLRKGRKFDELAKQSKDPGSKDRGGDLDWNSPASYVKPFGDALQKLEKGKYTEQPVQTQFGWHVILLEDVRPAKFPAFDEVKPQLAQSLQQQQFAKAVSDLRAKAKVE